MLGEPCLDFEAYGTPKRTAEKTPSISAVKRCSRGRARQLAFEASAGDYILAHLDCGEVFDSCNLMNLVGLYHGN